MAEDNAGGGFPWAPILALITAGSGIFLLLPSISSLRPPSGTSTMTVGDGYVRARLWQDPLETAREAEAHEAEAHEKEKVTPAPGAGISTLRSQIQQKVFQQPADESEKPAFPWTAEMHDHFLILPVMVSGGPYEEYVERRLRNRHAVLDGLHAAGFIPDETGELGFFRDSKSGLSAEKVREAMLNPEANGQNDKTAHWVLPMESSSFDSKGPVIAYEWCCRPSRIQIPGKVSSDYVLVMWLPEGAFEGRPLHQLANFFSLFACAAPDGNGGSVLDFPEIRLLGPENSGTLHNIMLEVGTAANGDGKVFDLPTRRALETTQIYACQPSASDWQVEKDSGLPVGTTCKQAIENVVKIKPEEKPSRAGHAFAFHRTILSDDRIIRTMREELRRRHVQIGQPSDHIAIVTELDTFYSQSLQATFNRYQGRHLPESEDELDAATIHFYTYLRGIDGQLPGTGGGGDKSESKEKSPSSSEVEGSEPQQRRKKVADTAGLDQSDYLQRLAEELELLDNRLWAQGRGGLKAVGVLGSDVYDKLEIMAALRPKLPGVLFFTNFLDAHLAHPDSWAATHNLLVVSTFGLQLNAKYQHGALPFRDSFQTAVFEATQEAVGALPTDSVQGENPRIYEIGRSGPWDLSIRGPKSKDEEKAVPLSPPREDVLRSNYWHVWPTYMTRPWNYPSNIPLARWRLALIMIVEAAIFLILLARLSRTKRVTSDRIRVCRPFKLLFTNTGIFVPVAGLASAYLVWHFYARQIETGEPFTWFEGISVCPSDIIRLFAVLLCIHFIIKAHVKLGDNARQLCNEFGLVPLNVDWFALIRGRRWKTLRVMLLGVKMLSDRQASRQETDMAAFWWDYQRRGLLPLRLARTLLLALVFTSFVLPMLILLGHMPPPFPVRGDSVKFGLLTFDPLKFEYGILMAGVAMSILLTFFVIDATRLHTDFIARCARFTTRWPDRTFLRFGYSKSSVPAVREVPMPSTPALAAPNVVVTGLRFAVAVLRIFTSSKPALLAAPADPPIPVAPSVHTKPKAELFGEANIADFWDILLIAKRTDAVNVLVYYPFIFTLLIMLSRIDYFDNWTWPFALVVVLTLQGALVLYHCCKLPTKARHYRDKVLARLRRRYRLAVAAGKENRAKAIETIITEVEEKLRQGAFVSLWEQPAFRAILLPSGGVGLWTLLQFLPH